MRRIFADTSYWIALLNPRDELHSRAIESARKYAADQVTTSEMVLVEFLNAFSGRGPGLRRAAAQAVAALRRAPNVIVRPQASELFEQAFARYESRPDKAWSLTDCASFVIMEEEKIEDALTYDDHFAQAGFRSLLR